jgi:hypothetical protein
MAYITDSGTDPSHPMGLIVVNLASGACLRRAAQQDPPQIPEPGATG